jgi:hypothetical protein
MMMQMVTPEPVDKGRYVKAVGGIGAEQYFIDDLFVGEDRGAGSLLPQHERQQVRVLLPHALLLTLLHDPLRGTPQLYGRLVVLRDPAQAMYFGSPTLVQQTDGI